MKHGTTLHCTVFMDDLEMRRDLRSRHALSFHVKDTVSPKAQMPAACRQIYPEYVVLTVYRTGSSKLCNSKTKTRRYSIIMKDKDRNQAKYSTIRVM